MNQLAHETSPYLLQHAHNPVDWFAWGDDAFSRARELDLPIFLSIGYSACHWCHVMERESFENAEIAELMNRWFINIKVDREERPDLDQIYMNAVTALSGHGGWPMSVFLTPDLKPFYGGTYWPPEPRMGMPGFPTILEKVHEAWETRRDDVHRGAEELTDAIVRMSQPPGEGTKLNLDLLASAEPALLRSADRTHGGFGSAPKFPHPFDLRVLMRTHRRTANSDALHVVELTLDKMSRGGIYDHLGGGFHRYSTDAKWLVPHFEKMLYDNALLVPAYTEAYQLLKRPAYAQVVRETLDYILREMTQPAGGFYSTQDADSEGVEGQFFVWSEDEITAALGPEDARIFTYCYDVSTRGNWEGKNILNRVKSHAEAARAMNVPEEELTTILERAKQTLFQIRSQRIAPGRDDKVLVAWNGMMIAAMSQAARVLQEPAYAEAAGRAAEFIWNNMRDERGRLLHAYKDGRARFNAYLDDYACLIDGLVELYQATFDPSRLVWALELADRMIGQFGDEDEGGFFYTSADHEQLIARNKDLQDNATPSGNGMAATALLKLGRICGRTDLEDVAERTLQALSGVLAAAPMACGQSLIALDFLLGPSREVVVVEGDRPEEIHELLNAVSSRFHPRTIVLRREHDTEDDLLPPAIADLLKGKTAQDGQATAYVCERGTCHAPVIGTEALQAALAE